MYIYVYMCIGRYLTLILKYKNFKILKRLLLRVWLIVHKEVYLLENYL